MDYEKIIKQMIADEAISKEIVEKYCPELAESEDERIRKWLICTLKSLNNSPVQIDGAYEMMLPAIDWLERQGEHKPCMIQWKGDNLKEVIDFTGKDKNFEKWFKSFEEYEKYVDDHNGIFKLFNADGSHYEIPVGAWIVKTPDGYNVASKAKYKQKPAEWSKEDEMMWSSVLQDLQNIKDNNPIVNIAPEFNWLKSLRPQNTWKPSDEQIKAIRLARSFVTDDFSDNPTLSEILIELEKQLKKLREE